MTTTTENKIKQGYKHTSIGIIPADWKIEKLGKLVSKVGSGITPRGGEKVYKEKGRPFLRSQNVGWGYLILNDVVFIDDQMHNTFVNSELKQLDVLLNITGASIGRSAIVNDKIVGGNVNQHVCIIRPKEKLDPKFLNLFLLSSGGQKQIYSYQAGGNREGINFKQIRSFGLPIPPLPEQKAIADCLSTWDKGIEKLSALIASKKEQKKGLMQQLLTGKKRLDGFTEEWNPKRLNVIGKVNYGTRIVKGNVEEGDYFVYGGGGKTFTNKEYNREDRMVIARFAMSKECARFVKGKFYLNDSGLTIDANEKTNQSFLDYLLFYNQHNIYKLRAGGAQQNLDVQAFRGTALSIPTIDEQIAIAEVLTIADKEIELLEKKLEAFKIQKKGLMQVLLTGERRLV